MMAARHLPLTRTAAAQLVRDRRRRAAATAAAINSSPRPALSDARATWQEQPVSPPG